MGGNVFEKMRLIWAFRRKIKTCYTFRFSLEQWHIKGKSYKDAEFEWTRMTFEKKIITKAKALVGLYGRMLTISSQKITRSCQVLGL